MKQPSKDLTQGSLWKNIFVFSIPLMLSNVLQVLFNMSDIAVVGRFAGPLALGSVGSTAILVSMYLPPSILAPGKSRLFPIRSTLLLSSVSAAVWPCYYSVSALQDLSLRSYIQRKN